MRALTLGAASGLMLLLFSSLACSQNTIYVDGSVSPLAPELGTSLAPYHTIQAAIDSAAFGSFFAQDTIIVAPGTYVEVADFSGKWVEIKSAAGPAATIIGSLRAANGEGSLSVLDGFTLSGGISPSEPFLPAGDPSSQNIVSNAADGAQDVVAGDLDGDGDIDLISASINDDKVAWYENTGNGVFGPQQVISVFADAPFAVFVADLDQDGDLDVLSASANDAEIAWYQNLGGATAFGSQQIISNSVSAARDVFAADLDGDGDLDVLAASAGNHRITWYENMGSGVFGPEQIITSSAVSAQSVHAADLDGDGDLDVLSASFQDDKIAWYENFGAGNFSVQQVISTLANGARSVIAADLDGDGDQDVVSASANDSRVAWYPNLGGGLFGPQQPMPSNVSSAWDVHATDIDGDGDLDLLAASANSSIMWFKNLGSGVFTSTQIITNSTSVARAVSSGDLDGDGDPDVLSASESDDEIAWYENRADRNAVSIEDASPTLRSCLITGALVAGVHIQGNGSPLIEHCTIAGNGVGIDSVSGAPLVSNSIVWDNTGAAINAPLAQVSFSDVEGGYPGTGNLDLDPLFVDALAGDYHLQPASPCIGVAGDGGDMGALQSTPLPFALSFAQTPVMDLVITAENGLPGSFCAIVYSLDPLNAASPGTGIWGGLHLDLSGLVTQIELALGGDPLFGGTLDASGSYQTGLPFVATIPLAGLTFHGVALEVEPNAMRFSNVASITLQ